MDKAEFFIITFKALDENSEGFVAVKAYNEKEVYDYAERYFKNRVSMIYPEYIFAEESKNYSDGCLDSISLVKSSN